MSLPLAIVLLSLGLQATASGVAFSLSLRTRRIAFLLLSLATFLMAVRRGFSLHQLLLSRRPLDTGAEIIALAISALLLAGLIGLRHLASGNLVARAPASPSQALKRLERTALLLGGLAVIGGAAAGYRAYRSSREAILQAEARTAGALARALRARAELRAAEGSPRSEVIAELQRLWEALRLETAISLCVVDSDGRLTLNTHRPHAVGSDVGASRVADAPGAGSTLRDLLRSRRSFEGPYVSVAGEEQVAAFAYSPALQALVAVHVPQSIVDARVRQAAVPWAVPLFVAVAAFFPLGFILLDWGYRSADTAARQALDSLKQSEHSLALALDAGGMGTFDWAVTTGAIRWTEGHARLWGVPLEEFDGRYETFASRVHPEDLPGLETTVEEARRTRGRYQRRYRVVWPDGSLRWVEGKGRFYYDDEGKTVRMTGVVTDISRQVQAEQEIEIRGRQQAAVAALAQAALDGTAVHDVLDQAVRLLATTLDVECSKVLELLPDGTGLRLRAGVGWREGAVGREIVPAGAMSQAGYTLQQPHPVVVEDLSTEKRFSGPDLLSSHGVVSGMSVVIQGQAERRPFGVLGAHTRRKRTFSTDDVYFIESLANILAAALEQARSEEAHRASEERFEAAFQSSPAAMTISTLAEGRYLAVNDRFLALTGYAREQVLGRTVRDLDWWEDFAQRTAVVQSLEKTGSLRDLELRYRTRGGALHEAVGSFVGMDVGGVACVLSLIEDVTERRRLEAQLAQSQKMEAVGSLAGGIAHDFNNLLNVIIGYGEMLRKEAPDEAAPARRRIDQILKAAERAASLTRQLLAFSRRQLLQPRVVDLNAVVHDVESLLRRIIGEDIDLVTVQGADLGRVKIDPGQIEQVILNLAINSRDAMPHGGKLAIETANADLDASHGQRHMAVEPGRYVVLQVSDTGHGMDERTKARVFEPFFTTKPEGKGTGLGLAMAYGIVKQSGGYIWLYSEVGAGTTFKVYLPRVEDPLSSSEAAADIRDLRGSETIALVEDENAARVLIQEVLQGYGYTVLAASDGDQALDVLAKHQGPVHLLLTDVVMPGISGAVLWERSRGARSEMKVLFMSGYTDEVVGRHGVLGPGIDLIQKPCKPEALARRIRQVLDRGPRG